MSSWRDCSQRGSFLRAAEFALVGVARCFDLRAVRVAPVVDADDRRPFGRAFPVPTALRNRVDQGEPAGEAVGQVPAVRHLAPLGDADAVGADEVGERAVLAAEGQRRLPHVVDARQEDEAGARLRPVAAPHGGQERAVVLAEVGVEEPARHVGRVHQVLRDGQPVFVVPFVALRPEGAGEPGQPLGCQTGFGPRELRGRRRSGHRWRFHDLAIDFPGHTALPLSPETKSVS